jgi:hypothetical protein
MPTANLGVGYVSASQTQKEVSINAAFDKLDGASNGTASVDCTAGGTVVVDAATYTGAGILVLSGTPAASVLVLVPDTKRLFVVQNACGQAADLQSTAGGTLSALPDGFRGLYANVGSDVIPIAVAASAGGGGSLATDGDVVLSGLADGDELVYDGSVARWRNRRPRHVVAANALTGVLVNDQVLLLHRFDADVTLPANFTDYLGHSSQAGGSAAATGNTEIKVQKATDAAPNTFADVGTITIGAAGVDPTFATSGGSAVSFAKGDVLRLIGPASADATFADFYATIVMFEG